MSPDIRMEKGRDKLIVMPFVPVTGQLSDGRGLGLHFLAGNLICLHPDLLECWFGWRVKSIFPGAAQLLAYCEGNGETVDIPSLGAREKVRFWMEGAYAGDENGGDLNLVLWDTRDDLRFETRIGYAHDDGLFGFRTTFFDWLDRTGLGFGGRAAGSWPEEISASALDALGRALKRLYLSYVTGEEGGQNPPAIDLEHFKRAVRQSPGSYLARDLLGWGLYKNNEIEAAATAFDSALALNPDGLGAHAGRMWIALAGKDRENALYHALEKGRCRGEDPEKARIFVAKKLG